MTIYIYIQQENDSLRERQYSLSSSAPMAMHMEMDKDQEAKYFPLRRVYGSSLSKRKRWYALNSSLAGRKISQFVKGKFFVDFPNEIRHVRIKDLWRQNGEHVPSEWFASQNSEEGYVVSLIWSLWWTH